jgi:CubicO group peptidase (beta-lactamase class C family)
MAAVDSEEWDAWDSGFGGATSTAKDLARFGQLLLKGGVYAGQRVLSRAAVAAMTAPQLIPGTRLIYTVTDPTTRTLVEYPVRGGNYGYGLFVWGNERSHYLNGSLMSANTFGHSGAYGSAFWADPDTDLVGVYLSVQPKYRRFEGDVFWKCDHFQDMVHAAILD